MRWSYPQPWQDLDHTADVGVAVTGDSPEEALARLVLAQAGLLAGGAALEARAEARLEVEGDGRAGVAVELLRELLFRFATARTLPAWCEVERFDGAGAAVRVGLAAWDPERHAEGVDLKAVTWHAARFEPDGAAWRAQIIFDI